MNNLSKRVAIVSAAGRGIGKGIARTLAEAGATVIVNSYRPSTTEETVEEITKAGGAAKAMPGDITKPDVMLQVTQATIDEFGKIDILVNNVGAGSKTPASPPDHHLGNIEALWTTLYQQNLLPVILMTETVLPHMRKRQYGKIINISSIVGIVGNAGQANYAAAKAGMVGLTKSVAKEVANRGIRVNAIAPGFITTDMTAEFSEENRKKILDLIPMKSFGSVEDVAEVSKSLASSCAQYITGQVIQVDGGMGM